MAKSIEVIVSPTGEVKISRATDIVFDNGSQFWEVWAGEGRALYRHPSRQACLDWERGYIQEKQDIKHGGQEQAHQPAPCRPGLSRVHDCQGQGDVSA